GDLAGVLIRERSVLRGQLLLAGVKGATCLLLDGARIGCAAGGDLLLGGSTIPGEGGLVALRDHAPSLPAEIASQAEGPAQRVRRTGRLLNRGAFSLVLLAPGRLRVEREAVPDLPCQVIELTVNGPQTLAVLGEL